VARHVRFRVRGGWHHVFTRGHNRGVLFAAIRYCGMKLADLSEKAGGMGNSAVTLAVQRSQEQTRRGRDLSRAMGTLTKQCEL